MQNSKNRNRQSGGRKKQSYTVRKKRITYFNKKMQTKLLIVFVVLLFALFYLTYRLVMINRTSGDDYAVTVLKQQEATGKTIPYKRGDIMDRNGTLLATSVKVYNLILDPKVIVSDDGKYLDATVEALSECFGYETEELYNIIEQNRESSYYIYEKQLTYEQIEGFEKKQTESQKDESIANIEGVWFEEEYKRSYPFSNLACSVIGFTSSGNVGNWGLEEYYNDYLNGIDGREYGYVNSDNNMETVIKNASDGDSIISTIDFNIQSIVEKHIAAYVKEYKPENVAVVVADPNNGEILAMASDRSYDLNEPRKLQGVYYNGKYITKKKENKLSDAKKMEIYNVIWRNFCISDTYEPGSTFKPVTVAAALEEAKATDQQTYVCDGGELVTGWDSKIKCHNKSGHGTIDLAQTLMFSCNDGLMQIAATLGKETFCSYQENFGYGMKTGIDLPGEARGVVAEAKDMSGVDLACYSFGQNFNVTAVQMVSAFSSLINGGYYYEPHMVKQIVNSSGGVVENVEKRLVKQTVTQNTSQSIKDALVRTVTEGTGSAAAVDGYVVGGKTGTAQKHDKNEDVYLLSFLGFAPYENPEVVCYVIVDEPDVPDTSSSAYASRLFSDIMEEVLPYMNIFPEQSEMAEAQSAIAQSNAAAEAQLATEQGEATQDEATQNEATQNEATQNEATQNEATQNETTEGEATSQENAQVEATQEETVQEDNRQEEGVQNELPDMAVGTEDA